MRVVIIQTELGDFFLKEMINRGKIIYEEGKY